MLRRPALATCLGALGLLLVGLLAAGGAASRQGGLWLGAPTLVAGLAVAAGVGGLVFLAGRGVGVAAGLLAVPVLLAAGAPLHALTGPPLFALFLAGCVAALALAQPRIPGGAFVPVLLVLYGTGAARTQARVGPDGDEPHYLMVADSLIRDADLDLARDYAEGRYRAFHPEPLEPHFRIRGRNGEIFSLHAVGLSLLVLPAYAAFGYPGASALMALLAALLMREVRALLRGTFGEGGLAEAVAWAVALSPPVVHYAGLVFTEIPAALCLAIGLRHAPRLSSLGLAGRLGWGAALAFLPWLNVRYAPLPILILLYALAHRPAWRAFATALLPLGASGVSLAAYHWALYGFLDPRGVYGRRPELALSGFAEGLPGLLLDQEFGLLVYAPAFALVVPGLVALGRRNLRAAAVVAALGAVVLLTAGAWPMWRGGFNPPARFLVPIVPALALALAAALARGVSAPAALLVGWGLWTGLGGLLAPELVHRDRDGTAPFFRERSGALEWTRLLPGFVLGEEDRRALAMVWAVALGAACAARGRRPGAGGLLAAAGGLVLAAGVAARLSDGRSDGREALGLLGRPGLAVPGWRASRSVVAAWGPESLGFGPLYEPHRHPDGATLADRVRLGAARIEIDLDPALPPGEPPRLVVRTETQPPEAVRHALRVEGGRLVGEWASPVARPDAGALRLRLALEGGSPLVIREVRLSTLAAGSGLSSTGGGMGTR